MSVTFRAYAGLGVLIDGEKLYREDRRRGCQHPGGGGAFCPQCGAPAWRVLRGPIDGFLPDEGARETDFRPVLRVGGREFVVAAVEGRREALVTRRLAVAGVGHWPSASMLPADADVEGARDEFRAALEPLGLWDEKKWGYWVLAEVSRVAVLSVAMMRTIYLVTCRLSPLCCFAARAAAEAYVRDRLLSPGAEPWMYSISEMTLDER